jgi:outer membrane receptor protein involved in Fe transport
VQRNFVFFFLSAAIVWADAGIMGQVRDLHGQAVAGATIRFVSDASRTAQSGENGRFELDGLPAGHYAITAEAANLRPVTIDVTLQDGIMAEVTLSFTELASVRESIVITSTSIEPGVDRRNEEVFNRTLFTRDDQIFQQLNAGINAGQHEGGGKSLEIRRFGFNMDHGGVNGGLKVLVDGVQQNQGTQGHGQGYLGSLKSVSPELIQDVTVVNGPFSAEYGDFSGLGVVHIRQRDTLPQRYTARLQGGNFNTGRGFLGFSPDVNKQDAYAAYEGSYSDGPFVKPAEYRRDNVNGNYSRSLGNDQKIGIRLIGGRNNFVSSGQIPLDLVASGQLDRFGYLDPSQGGRVKLGTLSAYYSKGYKNGGTLKLDGFVGRSLFDLFSNFTYFAANPIAGDAIQQHDSRLQQGLNAQYTGAHKIAGIQASFVGGGNFHDNQINVGLYAREGRAPTGVTTRANAHVTNGAGYAQETLSFLKGRLLIGGGLRYDSFRYGLADRVDPRQSGVRLAGRWQGKATLAYTPWRGTPVTFHANYGRGINSVDARAAVYRPDQPRLGATDFYQTGLSSSMGRMSLSADAFLIDRSNEQVYIPDDGTFELQGPSRAYGYEAKTSIEVTHHVSLNAGLTKVGNAYFKGGDTRVYVTNSPHFVANAALTVAQWNGWSGSLRMRAINHYRLDGEDPSTSAAGHTVFDFSVAKQVRRGVELNLSLDNLANRNYYETQNYGESAVTPGGPILSRIHGTPGYPLTIVAGITFRLGGK